MRQMIFVNLPVKDLKKSMAFYESLGYKHNPEFTDDTAACIVLSEEIHVMLLTHEKFKGFAPKGLCDGSQANEVLNCLSFDSRAAVDAIADKALASGGSPCQPPMDYGFMYLRSFQDPDGHVWEVMWMNPSNVQN